MEELSIDLLQRAATAAAIGSPVGTGTSGRRWRWTTGSSTVATMVSLATSRWGICEGVIVLGLVTALDEATAKKEVKEEARRYWIVWISPRIRKALVTMATPTATLLKNHRLFSAMLLYSPRTWSVAVVLSAHRHIHAIWRAADIDAILVGKGEVTQTNTKASWTTD